MHTFKLTLGSYKCFCVFQVLYSHQRALSGCSQVPSLQKFHKCDVTIATGLPFPPRTPSSIVQQYGRDNMILTVQWQPPQYDGGAPVNYTVTVSPSLSSSTTSATSFPVILPYNVTYTVSIVAFNCNGSSSAAMVTIRIGMLSLHIHVHKLITIQNCSNSNLEL